MRTFIGRSHTHLVHPLGELERLRRVRLTRRTQNGEERERPYEPARGCAVRRTFTWLHSGSSCRGIESTNGTSPRREGSHPRQILSGKTPGSSPVGVAVPGGPRAASRAWLVQGSLRLESPSLARLVCAGGAGGSVEPETSAGSSEPASTILKQPWHSALSKSWSSGRGSSLPSEQCLSEQHDEPLGAGSPTSPWHTSRVRRAEPSVACSANASSAMVRRRKACTVPKGLGIRGDRAREFPRKPPFGSRGSLKRVPVGALHPCGNRWLSSIDAAAGGSPGCSPRACRLQEHGMRKALLPVVRPGSSCRVSLTPLVSCSEDRRAASRMRADGPRPSECAPGCTPCPECQCWATCSSSGPRTPE